MSEIRTERLLLRRPRIDDLEAMHAVLSHPVAMRYWSSVPHETIEETREWLQNMIEAPADLSHDYIVELDGRAIGKAGCYRLPEIGFILAPAYWGQGLAREAVGAVIPRVFELFPIPAIRADVDPRNLGSLALLRSLRFEETGRGSRTWCIGGEWCDSIYLALQRGVRR